MGSAASWHDSEPGRRRRGADGASLNGYVLNPKRSRVRKPAHIVDIAYAILFGAESPIGCDSRDASANRLDVNSICLRRYVHDDREFVGCPGHVRIDQQRTVCIAVASIDISSVIETNEDSIVSEGVDISRSG